MTLLRPVLSARPQIRAERIHALDGVAPMDAAERLRDAPGIALLEAARPGRRARWSYLVADPLSIIEGAAGGPDPFSSARAELARLTRDPIGGADGPPFGGGLVGFLGYELRAALERLAVSARDDLGLPSMRLGLYDWVVAFDRTTGVSWLVGRAMDGDGARLSRRLADVAAQLRHAPAWADRDAGARIGPE
ncbi:MAG TPA: hypothetical protein VJZ72_03845, partial [Candidatus Limnocylindrales bacterium]|nr:hypothetical protein [Candidatus Limnocylindrales bacterium]